MMVNIYMTMIILNLLLVKGLALLDTIDLICASLICASAYDIDRVNGNHAYGTLSAKRLGLEATSMLGLASAWLPPLPRVL
jgi:hypothetical protein